MIIRGIDPGSKHSGYVDFDTYQYKVINFAEEMDNEKLANDILNSPSIDHIVIEHIVNRNQASKHIIGAAYWEGVFIGNAMSKGIGYLTPSAAQIRTRLVGANCSDTRVKTELKKRYSDIIHFTDTANRKIADDGRITLRTHAVQAFAAIAYYLES